MVKDQKEKALSIFLVLLLILCGCGKKAPAAPPPPTVTVSQPVRRAVTDYLEFTGNTQAVRTVQLVARVAGYLDKIFFRDGQIVKKGQLLFLIQQDTYEYRLQQAEGQILMQEAQLEYAQSQLTRYTDLLPEKAASQADVDNWKYQRDTARANLKAARANRGLARLDLSYTRITAPFTGRIDRRLQDPGNLVGAAANAALTVINQTDPLYVYFTVSDSDVARLMEHTHGIPGQTNTKKWPVFIGLAKEQGYPHRGHIDFAATSLTATTGTLLMRGVLPNPDGKILPGLYVRVRMPIEKKIALLVPDVALNNDQQGSYVLIVNAKNVVERRNAKTGSLVDTLRVIEEGLRGTELVIVNGLLLAAPGRQVTPVNPPR